MDAYDLDQVKSVDRVIQILELLDRERSPLKASQIARAIECPVSSTIALLRSMTNLGYLHRVGTSGYGMARRTATLLRWLENSIHCSPRLDALVSETAQATGDIVSLSCQNDLRMQILQTLHRGSTAVFKVTAGDVSPLFHSTVGLVALSNRSDREVRVLAERYNRRARGLTSKIDAGGMLTRVREYRAQGYGVGYGLRYPELGAIACALPRRGGNHAIILSVGGACERLRGREGNILAIMRDCIARHIAA